MAKLTYSTGESILDYIDKTSEEMGLSKSAFITMCVNQYKRQEESIAMTGQFQEIMAQVALMSDEEKKALSESNQP